MYIISLLQLYSFIIVWSSVFRITNCILGLSNNRKKCQCDSNYAEKKGIKSKNTNSYDFNRGLQYGLTSHITYGCYFYHFCV